MILFFRPHCSCPNGLVTSNMAPAHPHATSVAVYQTLFDDWLILIWDMDVNVPKDFFRLDSNTNGTTHKCKQKKIYNYSTSIWPSAEPVLWDRSATNGIDSATSKLFTTWYLLELSIPLPGVINQNRWYIVTWWRISKKPSEQYSSDHKAIRGNVFNELLPIFVCWRGCWEAPRILVLGLLSSYLSELLVMKAASIGEHRIPWKAKP